MSRRGWILFVLLSLVWGLPYLLIKVAVAEIPVPVLVFGRVGIATLVLLPLALREKAFDTLLAHWKPLAAFSILEFAIPWGLLSHAEKSLSSSTTGLLMASIPILAALMSRMAGDREQLGISRVAGLGLGLLGVFLLAAPTLGGGAWASVEALLAAACYSAAAIVAAKGLKDVPAVSMVAACLALATLLYLPPALTAWPDVLPSYAAMVSVLGLALVCTALAFVWFFALIREVGVSRAVIVAYLNPAVAGLAGVLILGEPFSTSSAIAFGLILCGSLMAAGTKAASNKEPVASGSGIAPQEGISERGRKHGCPACEGHHKRHELAKGDVQPGINQGRLPMEISL